MSWRVHLRPGADGTLHVWPDDDAIWHELAGTDCICGPTTEAVLSGLMVSHASLDGRELTE